MCYSIEPEKYEIFVKEYEFLSLAKNMGTLLSNKYSRKRPDRSKKSTTDVIKTISKREIQKIAGATDNLICNKIADKMTRPSKSSQKLHL